jgi:hypothetical protein
MTPSDLHKLENESSDIVEALFDDVHGYEGLAEHAVTELMVNFATTHILATEQRYKGYVALSLLIGFIAGFAGCALMARYI